MNSSVDFGDGDTGTQSTVCTYNEADLLTYMKTTSVTNGMGDISTMENECIVQYETY